MFGRFSPISSLSLSQLCLCVAPTLSLNGRSDRRGQGSTSQTSLTSLPNSLLDWKVRSPQVVSCHTRTHYCTPLTSIPLPSCLFVVTAEAERGNWKEEMTKESTTMLYRALHNLIERSLSLLSSLLFQLPIVSLSLSAQVVAE